MIKLHLFTHMALALMFIIGLLIAIHDKIKSLTWVYFEKTNSYNTKAKILYRVIMILVVVGGALITIYPIGCGKELLGNKEFENKVIICLVNTIAVLFNMAVGVYVGNKISKIFSNS